MLIMLVENNIDELRNLQRYVSECYTDSDIVPFSDSSDAMQFIQSDRFFVELRSRNKYAKVVFVSRTPDYAIDAWQYHVNDYLITPITLEGIQHTLKSCFSDSGM